MSSLALSVLTVTLGMFFILIGQFKITPKFFPDVHEDMKREFGRVNKVFPFYQTTGWRPYAKNYRMTVGIVEVVCGAVLILIPGRAKQLANVILLMTMLGAVSTHYALHDKLDRMAPGIVFSLLLLTRLILYQMGKYTSSYEKPIEVKTKDENEEEEEEDVTQESNDEESEDEIDDKQKTSNEKKKE